MTLLDRYIFRTHLAPFLFGFSVVVFLFLMQFILKYIDQLLGKGLSYWVITQLIALNLAWMVVLAVPIGVLFSTLLAFGGMSSVHEVTIMKASGIGLVRMMMPMVIMGFVASLALFWFNDFILPDANHRAKILISDIQRKKPTFSLVAGQFSLDLEGTTILARNVDSISGTLFGVTIYDHRKMSLLNIASADSGVVVFNRDYTKLVLTLFHGESHQMVPGNIKDYRIIDFKKYQVQLPASGFDFVRSNEGVISRGDREMSINDMKKIVNESKERVVQSSKRIHEQLEKELNFIAGVQDSKIPKDISSISPPTNRINNDTSEYGILSRMEKRVNFLRSIIQTEVSQETQYKEQIRQYEVEIHKKYSIPFACLVFVFVGCPLGIITRGGNFGISAAITLGFYIFYWACLIGGEKLADRGIISPFLSMWLGNILITIMGILLTLRVNNESFRIFPKRKQ